MYHHICTVVGIKGGFDRSGLEVKEGIGGMKNRAMREDQGELSEVEARNCRL